MNFLDIKVNPNSLLFLQRESRRSPIVRGMVRCAGYTFSALAVGAVGGRLNNFSLVFLFLFFLPLWETARNRLKYCLKEPLNQK